MLQGLYGEAEMSSSGRTGITPNMMNEWYEDYTDITRINIWNEPEGIYEIKASVRIHYAGY